MLSRRGRNFGGVSGGGRIRRLTSICTRSAAARRTEIRPTSSGQKLTRAEAILDVHVAALVVHVDAFAALKPPAIVPRTSSMRSVTLPSFSGRRLTAKRNPASV